MKIYPPPPFSPSKYPPFAITKQNPCKVFVNLLKGFKFCPQVKRKPSKQERNRTRPAFQKEHSPCSVLVEGKVGSLQQVGDWPEGPGRAERGW